MSLTDFIKDGYIIIAVALYIIGEFIKRTEFIDSKYIPFILLILGIVGSFAIEQELGDFIFQGILCTGLAILSNESIKQLTEKQED